MRKHLGREHLPVRFAADMDRFARERISPFLGFHRPCLFATERVDRKGKVRRTYRREDVLTLLAKLKSLPNAVRGFLTDGVTIEAIERAARERSSLHAARELNRARDDLFRRIHGAVSAAA